MITAESQVDDLSNVVRFILLFLYYVVYVYF